MSDQMKAVFESLLPPGAIWNPKPGGDFDHLLDGIGDNAQAVYEELEALADIRNPRQTPILSDLEKEYGVLTNVELSEAERRELLAGVKYVKPTTASFDHLQDNLRAAGFAGIIVTPNDPAIDPALITGDLIVNGPIITEQTSGYLMQAGGAQAYAGHVNAVAGYFRNIVRTEHVYVLPSDFLAWRFIFFVGGAASGWPGAPAIATYSVDYKLETELVRLILKYKPLHSWAVLVIDPIMIWTAQTAAAAYAGDFFAAAAGPDQYLIVGQFAEIQTSPDGVAWAHQSNDPSPAFTSTFLGAAYGDGVYVIVGNSARIESSPDGINWDRRVADVGYAGGWRAVIHGAGQFIALGEFGEIQTSPTGAGWTARTPAGGFANSFFGGAYGDGLYVIVGFGGEIQTSPDGVTWTARTAAGGYGAIFYDGAYGKGLHVIVGQGGEIQTSPDGVTWTARTAAGGYSARFRSIVFGNERFVAFGYNGEIQSSEDGITWKQETAAGGYSDDFFGGAYGLNKFLPVGENAEIQTG